MKGRINEIFESIQGEGLYLGEPQLFVRFFGCNLRCRYCDTWQEVFFEYTPQELIEEIFLHGEAFHSISFTGGEPLLQAHFLREVLQLTASNGYRNYLETNGMLYEELRLVIGSVDIVAMDMKLPSATGMGPLWGFHEKFLKIASLKEVFVKAVVSAATPQTEMHQACQIIARVNPSALLVLQPESRGDQQKIAATMETFRELAEQHRVTTCVIPQVHKMVGVK